VAIDCGEIDLLVFPNNVIKVIEPGQDEIQLKINVCLGHPGPSARGEIPAAVRGKVDGGHILERELDLLVICREGRNDIVFGLRRVNERYHPDLWVDGANPASHGDVLSDIIIILSG